MPVPLPRRRRRSRLQQRLWPLQAVAFLQGFMLWPPVEKLFMTEIGFDIDGDAVKAHPFAQPDPDRGDLVLGWLSGGKGRLVGPHHPHADPVVAALAAHIELCQCANDPLFEGSHERAHILAPTLEVEQALG